MISRLDGTPAGRHGATRIAMVLGACTAMWVAAPATAATCALDLSTTTLRIDGPAEFTATAPGALDNGCAIPDGAPPARLALPLPLRRAASSVDWGASSTASPAATAPRPLVATDSLFSLLSSPVERAADRSDAGARRAAERGDGWGDDGRGDHDRPAPTPLPASGWLLASVLVGLVASRRPAPGGATGR